MTAFSTRQDASKDLNRSKFTSSQLIWVRTYEFICLRVTKFPETKVYAHSLQEQEWHGHWQVPAALLAWADMLSNPILGSADLPITAVHERSDLSFVITSQKTRLMSLFPFCWISVASSTCSFPCSVRTIFIRVIQKAGTNRLYGNFVFSPALHIHLFHKVIFRGQGGKLAWAWKH